MNKTVAKLLLFHLCPCIISLCIMFTHVLLLLCYYVYDFFVTTNFPLSLPDIAVGAPYADAGSGRVYIYHGSNYGINTKPAQVKNHFPLLLLFPESLPSDSTASLYSAVYGLS